MMRAGSFGRRRIAKRSAWHRSARTLASDENAIADPWLVTAEAISEPPIDDAFAGVTRRAVRSVSSAIGIPTTDATINPMTGPQSG